MISKYAVYAIGVLTMPEIILFFMVAVLAANMSRDIHKHKFTKVD